MKTEDVAKVCHEANRAFCETLGDVSQPTWEDAAPWQRESAILGVTFRLENPDAPASVQHAAWMSDKLAAGWVYGETKDPDKKTHPCMVPYEHLPAEQRAKDALFMGVVLALKHLVTE